MLPRINEGAPYQADLPEYLGPPRPSASANAYSESGDLLLIDPRALEQVSGEELDSYLKVACSAALPLGGRNKEFALVLLSATGGDLREALHLLLRPRHLRSFLAARHLDDLSLTDTTAWTPLETQLFYKSIVKVGKDFYRVANELRRRMRNLLQQPALNSSLSLSASGGPLEAAWQPKSTRQCIEFYFFWKKFCPDEYRRLQKRIQQTNADYTMRKKSIDEAATPLVVRPTPKSPSMSPRLSFSSSGGLFGFQYRPSHPPHPTTASSPRPELPTITLTTQVSSTAATMATSESDSFLESSCATATRSSSLTGSLSESQSLDVDVNMEDVGDDTEMGSLELSEPAELSSRSPPAFLVGDGDGDAEDGERDEHMSTSSLPVRSVLRHPHAHPHPAFALTHARSSGLESLAAASAVLSPELAPLAFAPGSGAGAGAANAPRSVPYAVGVVASELLAKSESTQSYLAHQLPHRQPHQQHHSNAFVGTPSSSTTGFASIVPPGGMGGEEELVVKKRRGRPSKAAKALAAAKQQKLVAARAPPAESSLPFTCNRCSRRFANVKALNAHKKRHKNADANAGLMDGAPPLLSYSSQPSQSSSFIGALSGSTLTPLSLPLPLRLPPRPPLQMPMSVPVPVTVPMVPVSRSAAQIVSEGLLAAGVIVRPAIIAPPSDSFHHSSYSKLQTASSLATYFSHH